MAPLPTIAIDGPGASGKNTVGLLIAQRLGYRFIDTGAMYRALAWLALEQEMDFSDEERLVQLVEATLLRVLPSSPEHLHGGLCANGRDLTPFLHLPAVDAKVSIVARISGVRRVMVALQRQMAAEGGVVMVGRDIGTVVLPSAALKVYLDAPVEERARRRFEELQGNDVPVSLEAVLAELRSRDALDQEREDSPLRPASDAWIVDTDGLTPRHVAEAILREAIR